MDSVPRAYESHDEYGGGSIRLLLIRHGESEANLKSLIGRIAECPLTEKGRKEAVSLGTYLNKRGIKFDNVFASSAERAKQTAILTCQQDLFDPSEIVITKDLIEIHRGDWEAKNSRSVFTPEVLKMQGDINWKTPGEKSESCKDVEDRFYGFVEKNILPLSNPNKQIVVATFSHGTAIKCFLRKALGVEHKKWKFGLSNTSVTELVYHNDEWFLHRINSIEHLKSSS